MRYRRILGLTAFVVLLWALPVALLVARNQINGLPRSVVWSLICGFPAFLLVSAIVLRSRTIIGAIVGAVTGIQTMGLHADVVWPVFWTVVGALAGFALEVTITSRSIAKTPVPIPKNRA
jgi:hypothetical protein